MNRVPVLKTGSANLASVVAAFERLGAQPFVTIDEQDVRDSERLVVPGVGSFAAVITSLADNGLVEPLRRRLQSGRPTLAICLGLQLFAASSEESEGVRGLGVLPGRVRRLPDSVVVPQLGWNQVSADSECRLLDGGAAYYANSYCLEEAAPEWSVAWSEHGTRFVAALERGPVLACQFHPELSGRWGAALLERWMEASRC
jgi:imidazole glycerol phosphate synthase glutamine amidotransferase subunit